MSNLRTSAFQEALTLYSLYDRNRWLIVADTATNERLRIYTEVTVDTKRMREVWSAGRVILMREYAGEKKLVIGCGRQRCCTWKNLPSVNYLFEHSHLRDFTIDYSFDVNPSLVAFVGFDDIVASGTLPAGVFDEVVFEYVPDWRDTRTRVPLLLHALRDGGSVVDLPKRPTMIKHGDALYSVDDRVLAHALRTDEDVRTRLSHEY
jgi:hypothetical protein